MAAASSSAISRATREEDLLDLPTLDPGRDLVLGDGSNVLLASDVPGTVWLNRIMGRRIGASKHDQVSVSVGAGEPWHDVVRWTLEAGLSGLENLSLIPGRCGAAPLQNIGAYGLELAQRFDSLAAWDFASQRLVYMTAAEWAADNREEAKRY